MLKKVSILWIISSLSENHQYRNKLRDIAKKLKAFILSPRDGNAASENLALDVQQRFYLPYGYNTTVNKEIELHKDIVKGGTKERSVMEYIWLELKQTPHFQYVVFTYDTSFVHWHNLLKHLVILPTDKLFVSPPGGIQWLHVRAALNNLTRSVLPAPGFVISSDLLGQNENPEDQVHLNRVHDPHYAVDVKQCQDSAVLLHSFTSELFDRLSKKVKAPPENVCARLPSQYRSTHLVRDIPLSSSIGMWIFLLVALGILGLVVRKRLQNLGVSANTLPYHRPNIKANPINSIFSRKQRQRGGKCK